MIERTDRRAASSGTWLARSCLLMALTVVTAGCSPLDDVMAAVFGRSMRNQPSLDPYENPRSPAEGSVPFAAGNFPAAPGQVNVGQPERPSTFPPVFGQLDVIQQQPMVMGLVNPMAPTTESLARGEQMYARSCLPCHGATGDGVGPMAQVGYPPFSLLATHVTQYPDGYIYGMIRVGRGLMPAYGHQISEYDRWHIVNYVRQLQGVLSNQTASAGGPPAGIGAGDGGRDP